MDTRLSQRAPALFGAQHVAGGRLSGTVLERVELCVAHVEWGGHLLMVGRSGSHWDDLIVGLTQFYLFFDVELSVKCAFHFVFLKLHCLFLQDAPRQATAMRRSLLPGDRGGVPSRCARCHTLKFVGLLEKKFCGILLIRH